MLKRIKNKILNYFFSQFVLFQKKKQNEELLSIISKFKRIGTKFSIGKDHYIINGQYVEIGDNFTAGDRFRLEAWNKYKEANFTPSIKIGNNVIFNNDIHIGCINSIEIGDNCLFASRIYVTDHHHGEPTLEMLKLTPRDRPLISKGPVIIENNVWIGEGVAIMPNVIIGKNSIIATNAVVTKSVPQNSVVAGVPAKVIRTIN